MMNFLASSSSGPFRRRAPRAGGPGFTLAEVLVSVGVLLVAFMGVITVYLVGYGDISEGGKDTIAAMAAQTLAENIRNQPQNNLQQLDGIDSTNPGGCPGTAGSRINTLCLNWAAQVAQLPEGRGRVTVTRTLNGNVSFFQVNINLTWTEPTRGLRQLTVVAGRSS